MIKEDEAFINAYVSCMGASSRKLVEDVINMYNNHDMDETQLEQQYGNEAIKVIDAMLLWHMAIQFIMKASIK